MYCPSCRGEFREGFTRCEDCDENLVAELPEKVVKPGYIQLATAFTEGEIAVIKAILDQEGIDYYFHGEQAHRLAALPLEARLMVREDFKEDAEALLSNLDES